MAVSAVWRLVHFFALYPSETKEQTAAHRRDACAPLQKSKMYRLLVLGRYNALSRRDNALSRRDNAPSRRDNAPSWRDNALSRRDNALSRRDNALSRCNNALSRCNNALSRRDNALSRRDNALSRRDNALSRQLGAPPAPDTSLYHWPVGGVIVQSQARRPDLLEGARSRAIYGTA